MTQSTLPLAASGLPASLKSAFTQQLANSHSALARLRAGPALELYYEVGDPHSQLCAAVARQLLQTLNIPLSIRLVSAPSAETYPEAQRQRDFAWLDAQRLAPVYGLPAPQQIPEQQRIAMQSRLAQANNQAEPFLRIEAACLTELAEHQSITPCSGNASHLMARNAKRREALGHYLPAMWQFHGEWFWALDRLDFLAQRLQQADALNAETIATKDESRLNATRVSAETTLEFWFSFRSPYSYLAAVKLLRKPEIFDPARLKIRPVLPMVMRGLPVPLAKRLYIVRDVKRCADAQNIAFGRIHDPVGNGVMRLLTVFPYQADAATQLQFCVVAGQSIWAEGLDTRKDQTIRSILERCNLDWPAARDKLNAAHDTVQAEANRDALFEAGLWGVPSFRLDRFVTWGQDRMWMIEQLLQSDPA